MNNESIRIALAKAAEEFGAEGYELTVSSTESASAGALQHEISSVEYSLSGGMTVRCVKNGRSGYASSELVSPEMAAELVERACANALVVDDEDVVGLFPGSESYASCGEKAQPLPETEELKAQALQLQEMQYAASDRIVDGTRAAVTATRVYSSYISSAGLDLSYESSLVYHMAAAAVKEGELAANTYRMAVRGKESLEETAQKAVESALSKLGADTVPSGKYNIIMDSSTVRSLLGCFSSVFSARSAYMKTSLFAGREGEPVASENFTLVDDPFHPDKFGHCPFDGEGVAVYKKNVIENGVLKTLLYNRMYAKLMGRETTGNAAGARGVTPIGLYVQPGELSNEALMEKLGDGLYITALNGLHAGANTQSGDFSLQAEGYLVEGGKKSRPIKNFTLADNFFTLLKKVDAISSELEFGAASSYGAPEILFKDISVAGK